MRQKTKQGFCPKVLSWFCFLYNPLATVVSATPLSKISSDTDICPQPHLTLFLGQWEHGPLMPDIKRCSAHTMDELCAASAIIYHT